MIRIASKFICRGKHPGLRISALMLSLLICAGGCSVQSGPKPNESIKNEAGATAATAAATVAQENDPVNTYYVGKEVESLIPGEGEQVTVAGAAVSEENIAILFSVSAVDPESEYGERKYSSSIWVYDKAGTVITRTEMLLPANGAPLRGFALVANPEGGFTGLFTTESKRYQLCKFDEKGQTIGELKYLSGIDPVYSPGGMEYDSDGNINITAYGLFYTFSPEGESLLKVEDECIGGDIYSIGGKIYVSGYYTSGLKMGQGDLFEMDSSSGSLGDAIEGSGLLELDIFSADGELYGSDMDSFFRVDTDTLMKEPVLYWNRTDLVVGHTEREMYSVGDNSFLCVQSAYNTFVLTLTLLNQAPPDYMEGKTILTLAGISIGDNPALQKAVNDFNRENPEYRIEIVDYMMRYGPESIESREEYLEACDTMMQRIKMEIMSGNGPDMLLNSGGEESDLLLYASSGLLTDLVPLMNADSDFHEDDYVSSILNASKKDGKLYPFPLAFYFSGLFAPADRIPDVAGWTLDTFPQFAEGLPEGATPFSPYISHSYLLREMLSYSEASFVDSNTGKVQFDSPEFIKLLEIVKAYSTPDTDPNVVSSVPVDFNPLEAFISGEYCFYEVPGSTPWYFAACDNICGSSGGVFTGYPSITGSGPLGNLAYSIGIVDNGKGADGCWAFLKSLLTEENQRNLTATIGGDSFRENPILSSLLDEYIETSTKGIQPGQMIDMFDREAKPVTAEQAKEYRELIDGITMIRQNDSEITSIILEEAAAYFKGQKTSEEVVSLIQNRVQTLVYERS